MKMSVSYTHLDVYKRQEFLPCQFISQSLANILGRVETDTGAHGSGKGDALDVLTLGARGFGLDDGVDHGLQIIHQLLLGEGGLADDLSLIHIFYSAAVFKVASPDLQQNWSKNFKKHCKILSLSAANGPFNQAYSRAKLSDNKKWRRFYRNFREKISENAVKLRESLSISEIGAAAPQAGAVPRTKRRQAPAAKA